LQRVARSHLAWPARGMLPVPSSAGATSSQLRRQRPCAPASSEEHVSHTVVRPGAICHFFNCRYGALAHQRLGPRSPPPRSPPGWTERLPSFTSSHDSSSSRVLSSDRRVLHNSRRRAPRVQPGPRCRAIRSLRWVPGTATRHRLPPACSPPRRPRSRARRARRRRRRCCRCGSGT